MIPVHRSFLYGSLLTLGIIALGSFLALQDRSVVLNLSSLTASLTNSVEEPIVPVSQNKRLEFSDIPISSNLVKEYHLAGEAVFSLNGPLTPDILEEAVARLKENLTQQELQKTTTNEVLSAFLVSSIQFPIQKTSVGLGEKAPEFTLNLEGRGQLVSLPWTKVYDYLVEKYSLSQKDLAKEKLEVAEFNVIEQGNNLFGHLILVGKASQLTPKIQSPETK